MKKNPDMSVAQKIAELSVAKRKKAKTINFLHDMKEEMGRVSWTTKDELRTCGKIVIGAVFFLGRGIYLVDLLIRLALNGVGTLVRLLGA